MVYTCFCFDTFQFQPTLPITYLVERLLDIRIEVRRVVETICLDSSKTGHAAVTFSNLNSTFELVVNYNYNNAKITLQAKFNRARQQYKGGASKIINLRCIHSTSLENTQIFPYKNRSACSLLAWSSYLGSTRTYWIGSVV